MQVCVAVVSKTKAGSVVRVEGGEPAEGEGRRHKAGGGIQGRCAGVQAKEDRMTAANEACPGRERRGRGKSALHGAAGAWGGNGRRAGAK